jgi:hypothetical protein
MPRPPREGGPGRLRDFGAVVIGTGIAWIPSTIPSQRLAHLARCMARQVSERHGAKPGASSPRLALNAAARPDQPCICQTEPRPAGCQAAALTSDRVVIGVEFPGAPALFSQSAHEVDAHADRPLYHRNVGRRRTMLAGRWGTDRTRHDGRARQDPKHPGPGIVRETSAARVDERAHVVRPISTGRTTARQATRRCRTADPAIRFDRISAKQTAGQKCPKPFNLNSFL